MSSYTDLCRLDPFSQSFEGVRALVGEGKTAGMTQHVGMHRHRQPSLLAVLVQQQVDGRAVQRHSLLTEENVRPGAFMRVRSTSQALMARISSPRSGWVVERPPLRRASCSTRLSNVHLLQHQAAGLGVPEPMTKHQQD